MQRIPHVPLVICDGFFGFPAIGSSRCVALQSPAFVPAGVLELIEQLFLQLHSLKLWLAFIAQVGVPL